MTPPRKLTTSELRANTYPILDGVLETGEPVEVERRGRTLRILVEPGPSRLEALEPHDAIVGDPEALVHLDWSQEWRP